MSPMSSATATASGMFCASPAMTVAARTEANEMTAPTERSTPPVIITRVTPTAAMPTTLAWRSTLKKLTGWMKPGDSQAATRMMRRSPSHRPAELRPTRPARGRRAASADQVTTRAALPCRWRWPR